MSIYSRPAFLAEKTLADAGIVVTKNHLRELIAALCGFKSLAALQASPCLHPSTPPSQLLLLMDRALGTARCKQLLPHQDPDPILRALVRFLDATAASSMVIHQSPGLPLPSVHRYARSRVLAAPEMDGHTTGTQEERDGQAPVRDLYGHVLVNDRKVVVALTGEYSTAGGAWGSVHVDLSYRSLTPAIHVLESQHIQFLEEVDLVTAEDMDYQFPDYS